MGKGRGSNLTCQPPSLWAGRGRSSCERCWTRSCISRGPAVSGGCCRRTFRRSQPCRAISTIGETTACLRRSILRCCCKRASQRVAKRVQRRVGRVSGKSRHLENTALLFVWPSISQIYFGAVPRARDPVQPNLVEQIAADAYPPDRHNAAVLTHADNRIVSAIGDVKIGPLVQARVESVCVGVRSQIRAVVVGGAARDHRRRI